MKLSLRSSHAVASSFVIGVWMLMIATTGTGVVVAQTTFNINEDEMLFGEIDANVTPNHTIEKSCFTGSSNCSLRVSLRCRYILPGTEKSMNCIDLQAGKNNAFTTMSRSQCAKKGDSIEVPATITYRMCNDNDVLFQPNKGENRLRFRDGNNPVDPQWWDNGVPANTCRVYKLSTKINLCNEKRFMDIAVDGNLNQPGDNYCRCYLWKQSVVDLDNTNDSKTDPPQPTKGPSYDNCNLQNALLTELASPENKVNGRYVEIFFGSECAGKVINMDLGVLRMEVKGGVEHRTYTDLSGKTIGDKGFFLICNQNNGNRIYGENTCDLVDQQESSPADLTGIETIAIVEGNPMAPTPNVLDVYGYAHRGGSIVGSNQDFTGGRAVRKIVASSPSGKSWDPKDWIVIPGDSVHTKMDPRVWKVVIVPPKAELIITELFDPFVSENEPVPRFIELYAPDKNDRGVLNDDLKLVIFRGESSEPDWRYALEIDNIKDKGYGKGFLVVCNDVAFKELTWYCDETFDFSPRSGNGKGRYQMGIVNGDQNGYFTVDTFGDIGAVDNAFIFRDSRAVRKLTVTDPAPEWSELDWIIYKTGSERNSGINGADPQLWKEVKFTTQPSIVPSAPPSLYPSIRPSEYELDCDLYFTELADPVAYEDVGFIEIQTTCPNQRIRNVFLKTWKRGQNTSFELRVKVPADGYIIICRNKNVFEEEYGKECDIEKPNSLPKGLYTIALLLKGKRLDIYGKINRFLPEENVYQSGRAYRDLSSNSGSEYFDELLWYTVPGKRSVTALPADCDPRSRTEAPLELFFTEFADPVSEDGGVENRFIELYSPNRRKYRITEDLSIIKFSGYKNPYAFQSLKGMKINKKGFLVLCIEGWSDECSEILGRFSIVNGPLGTADFSLAACDNPPEEGMEACPSIDEYGLGTNVARHNFRKGRAVRRLDADTPSATFHLNDWVIVPGELYVGHEVEPFDTDPSAWYEVDMSRGDGDKKVPPSPAPTWEGKGKSWRK